MTLAQTEEAAVHRYRRDEIPRQQRLWRRCVFVDWHGVLCDLPFWHSITSNPGHQQRRRLEAELAKLFGERRELVEGWMRGEVDSGQVTATLPELPDRRCGPDFLYRKLFDDCRKMPPRKELLKALSELPDLTLVVLATDNMDCFSDSIPDLRPLRKVFDAALCSSDLGVLKSEDPMRFFGELLHEHGVDAKDSILIDDAERNCAAFEALGGTAIRYSEAHSARRELSRWASNP